MLRYLRSRIGSSYQVKSDHFDDFVDFNRLTTHGFPQKVSSMCVDEQLGYIAIGTKDGRLLIFYLNSAQQLSANFGSKMPISSLYFVAGANTLMIQCNDSATNSQHFIRCQIISDQLNFTHLNNEKHLKRITCCEMVSFSAADGQPALLIGTIIGNIYALLVRNMELIEHIVFLDTALKDISEFDSQQKAVNRVTVHHEDHTKLYILFNNSIVVLYNITTDEVLQTYKTETQITFMSFSSPTKLLCSHDDGTYSLLKVSKQGFEMDRKRPFGANKCTKMTKIISSRSSNATDDEFVIFAGGVPVDELDNRFALSIFCVDKSLILDFDSAILDFCVFNDSDDSSHILFVLCVDEIVAIDLHDPIWRMLPLPFLHPIHSSPVTCITTVTSLSENAQNLLGRLATDQRNASNIFSRSNLKLKNAQISQRERLNNATTAKDMQLVVTGHENGVVNVWLASELSFKPWISINTARDFEGFVDDSTPNLLQNHDEDSANKETQQMNSDDSLIGLPPVRKAGIFDPYSDDHRLAVQKIFFDPKSAEIAIGGRAGQLLVYEGMPGSKKDLPGNEVLLLDMTLSDEATHCHFNHRLSAESPIQARSAPFNYPPGYCLMKNTIAQFKPAVPVTSIAWDNHLEVLAAGNEFGYAICCLRRREVLLTKTLIPSTDLMQLSSMDGPLSRFKSVKKSIRQSFRKKRRPNEETFVKNFRSTEREIVQRSVNPNILGGETPPSLVKVIVFHTCNVSSSSDFESQHLFVGTHGSVVFIHAFHRPTAVQFQLQCPLVKEIRLQHQAPIVAIVYAAEGSNPMGAGRLFVFTEEQIRTFTVPGLRPSTKLRFTATEGSRIKKAAIIQLRSRIRRARSPENFIAFSTNRAELYLIPTNSNLKRQYKVQFSEHSDSTAIISATLSSDGQLFFLRPGGSEFERCSLDSRHNI